MKNTIATEEEIPLKLIPGIKITPPSVKYVNEKEFERKAIIRQFLVASLINVSFIMVGISFSFPAIALTDLSDPSKPTALTSEELSWFASIGVFTIPIGNLMCGYFLDTFGRKASLYIFNIVSLISWIIVTVSSTTDKTAMFIEILVGRAISGIMTGFGISQTSIFITEIAQKEVRGRLVTMSAVNVGFGTFLLFILGYTLEENWRLIAIICCAIHIFALLCSFVIPESPLWLASKGHIDKAEKSLRFFKGLPKNCAITTSEYKIEMQLLREQEYLSSHQKPESFLKLIRKPEAYKPFGFMLIFITLAQLSGIMALVVYPIQISKASGVQIDPLICSMMIGGSRFIGTILTSFVMDYLGRRSMAIISGWLMSACLFGLSANIIFGNAITWLPLVLIVCFVFAATFGVLSLPMTMNAEIYSINIRASAAGYSACYGFAINFVVIKMYPLMAASMGHAYLFLSYAIGTIICVIFCYFFMPETKGKTLQEIENMYKKKKPSDQNPI